MPLTKKNRGSQITLTAYRDHMKSMVLILGLIVAGAAQAQPMDAVGNPEWERPFLDIIASCGDDSSDEAIEKLGEIVGKLSKENEPEKKLTPAYAKARSRLADIPGAASFYQARILEKTEWEMGASNKEGTIERGWAFHILSQIQGPETVQILGDLLSDERDPTKGAATDSTYVPNSLKAVEALHELGLTNPPIRSKHCDAARDLNTWKLWYEQIRSGSRRFSFEGDSSSYSLADSLTTPAVREKKVYQARESNQEAAEKNQPSRIQLWILPLLAIGVISGLWWLRDNKVPP